jgi:VWFA-related protein
MSMRGRIIAKWLGLTVTPALLATAILSGQAPAPGQQGTVFRAASNTVSSDVIVRDRQGRFVPDLKVDEFKVFEDGVEQRITNFYTVVGGRATSQLVSTVPSLTTNAGGLILPRSRPPDTSGRIFIIFIDDLHLTARDTPRVRNVLEQVRDTLIHPNDLVGFVSSGPSSIEINPSYDYQHRRFNEAISKVIGSAPSLAEMLDSLDNPSGISGLRFSVHVAFQTAYKILEQAGRITNRRKSFIYVSSGFHFNPFKDERLKIAQERYSGGLTKDSNGDGEIDDEEKEQRLPHESLTDEAATAGTLFAEADLVQEVAELIRYANRANTTFYTVDPRGLVSHDDITINRQLSPAEWRDFIGTQHSALMAMGENTGGFCICNDNDFKRGLQRIDNETSDYYILGYNSNNPDPKKIRRSIKIEITRPGMGDIVYRPEYTLPPPPRTR